MNGWSGWFGRLLLRMALVVTTLLPAAGAPWPALSSSSTVADPPTGTTLASPLHYGFQAELLTPALRATAIALTKQAGFGWVKQQVRWSEYEQWPGRYDPERLGQLDALVEAVHEAGLHLLLTVTRAPAFYGAAADQRPDVPVHLERFLQFLARRYRGKVQAYETWNEPNLAQEWNVGPLWPQGPRELVRLQQHAYAGVKAGDPAAVVVFPALTPTGVGECPTCDRSAAIDDRVYLDQVYQVGGAAIRRAFDVLGVHAYGYINPPEVWPDNPSLLAPGYREHPSFYFQRFTQLRDVMLAHGDAKPLWLTEVGWSACTQAAPGYDDCLANTEADQARYLTDANGIVQASYPYVTHVFVWNLNFQMLVAPQDQRWGFGVIRADGSPRPAYTALALMPKAFEPKP